MAGKLNAYYDGISKELQKLCDQFTKAVEHKVETELLIEEDYKTVLTQDVNEIKEIKEILDTELSNDEKEDAFKECARIIYSKVNNFNVAEFQEGFMDFVKLESVKYSLTLENVNGETVCSIVSKESGIEYSVELDPKQAIEFLQYMDNIGFGDMETKIEIVKEFLESEDPDKIEKETETKEKDDEKVNPSDCADYGIENSTSPM